MSSQGSGPEESSELEAVQRALLSRWPENRIAPDLSRITMLCELLGDPQLAAPTIHIAGTNGKTSVARIVESLLRAVGLRTGLTTSPALRDLTERIQVDGVPVSAQTFIDTYRELEPYLNLVDERSRAAGGPEMTMFEVITGMAFAGFADAPVGAAVVETGMGGRWDATNVCRPDVAVITPIGWDHMDYLGSSLPEIAREKAGIIKEGSVVVTAAQQPEVLEVLLEAADTVGANVLLPGTDFELLERALAVGGQALSIRVGDEVFDELYLPLHGRHQADNAALAVAAVYAFLGGGSRGLDPERVREGLAEVRSPGRLEVLGHQPLLLVDSAHNPHGVAAVAAAVPEGFAYDRLVAVVSVMRDKQVAEMLQLLAPVADEVVVTDNGSPRALPATELAELARQYWPSGRVHVVDDLSQAVDSAAEMAGPSGCVLVTGSVVTAGVVRDAVKGER